MPDSSFVGSPIMSGGIAGVMVQNLPQPGEKFPFAAAAELAEVAIGAEQGILHEIARAKSPPQTGIELGRGEDRQR